MKLPTRSRDTTTALGVDPTPARARPNATTAVTVAVAAGLVAAIWNVAGATPRDDLQRTGSEIAAKEEVRDTLTTRLAAARDSSRDERMALLNTNAHQLDLMLPHDDTATSIEQFEIALPDQLTTHGLTASEISRAPQLASSEHGGSYIAIRLSLSGPRDGLFSWLDALKDHDRLVTVHNLQFGFDRSDPGQVNAQTQLRLWYAPEQDLEAREQQAAAGLDTTADDDLDGPDDDTDTDDGFVLEADPAA